MTLTVVNPATEEPIAELEQAGVDETDEMVARAREAYGRIDILFNNVGQSAREKATEFWCSEPETWRFVLEISLFTALRCSRHVVPEMRERRSGKIINISSSTAYWGTPNFLHYVASKAALIGMTRSLAREVGEFGICVNAIAPGLVEHEGQNAPKALTELQLKERSIKRLQTPDDLMGTLVFLCSSDSDFMTGQTIVVDGGSVFH